MSKNGRSCGSCAAFVRSSHTMGTCRAKPPQGVPHVSISPVTTRPEMSLLGGWPPVNEDEWCLEWRASVEH